MKSYIYLPVVAALLTCAHHATAATLVNGAFEAGNLSGWTVVGTASAQGSVSYPAAGGTVDPYEGSYSARLITVGATASTIASTMGVSEATLEASNSGADAINGALVYQTVPAVPGDSFQFRWNFVEQDYLPFDDWAFYGISFNGEPATITRFASLATVGPDDDSTINGWETLTVNISVAGNYTFYFGVVNAEDDAQNSDLWLDGVVVGDVPPVPEPKSVGLASIALAGFVLRQRRR